MATVAEKDHRLRPPPPSSQALPFRPTTIARLISAHLRCSFSQLSSQTPSTASHRPFRVITPYSDLYGKTFKKPRRPYEKERLDAELKLVGEYGLHCKRELWRVQYALSRIRNNARMLLTLDEKNPRRIFEGEALLQPIRLPYEDYLFYESTANPPPTSPPLLSPTVSPPPPTSTNTTTTQGNESNTSRTAIIGVVSTSALFLVVLIISVCVFFRIKRAKKKEES